MVHFLRVSATRLMRAAVTPRKSCKHKIKHVRVVGHRHTRIRRALVGLDRAELAAAASAARHAMSRVENVSLRTLERPSLMPGFDEMLAARDRALLDTARRERGQLATIHASEPEHHLDRYPVAGTGPRSHRGREPSSSSDSASWPRNTGYAPPSGKWPSEEGNTTGRSKVGGAMDAMAEAFASRSAAAREQAAAGPPVDTSHLKPLEAKMARERAVQQSMDAALQAASLPATARLYLPE